MDSSSDFNLKFLEAYYNESCIWDPTHIHHKNKKEVSEAWQRISSDLGEEVGDLKKRKESLMATFRGHLRKKRASIKSGAGGDDVYKPIWYAYDIMESFLGRIYDCNPTVSTQEMNGGTQASEISYFTDDANEDVHPELLVEVVPRNLGSKCKRKYIVDDSVRAALNKLDVIAEKASDKEDELDKFSHYIAASLRKLKTISCIKAQDEIQAVLSKYRLLDVTEYSTTSSK